MWREPEVVAHILSSFGYPRRKVELDSSNIAESLKKAVRQYGSIKPRILLDTVTIFDGIQAYNLTTLAKPFGRGILDVVPAPITSPAAVFNEFEYYRLRQPPYVDMAELVTDRMYYKEIGLLTGTDFDWEWDQVRTILLVRPIPSRTFTASYLYNNPPSKLEDVIEADQDWIVDYTQALCEKILGRVRGKFSGVPGNDLPVTTDHESLLAEATASLAKLEEDLKATVGDWVPPVRG